jgi:cystathionine beta-lyase
MNYNFDDIIDRYNTDSLKYDFARESGKPEGILPFWVADMDFRVAPAITDAIIAQAKHGIYGYTEAKKPYYDALSAWFSERHNFPIRPEWVLKTPGVVFAIALAVNAFTEKGDAVLIQKPVYYPFFEVIEDSGRRVIGNPLVMTNGHYEIDFEDFEAKIADNHSRLFLLCSPHTPGGRVWTREELTRMGDICLRHSCLVLSDEIHCDFVLPEHKHTVFSAISEEFAQNSVICTSPTKSFNIATLQVSNLIIQNRELKHTLRKQIDAVGYSQLSGVSLAACRAAYERGGEWFDAAWSYIRGNLDFMRTYLRENIPQIRLIEPEGTYLVWLDCRESGIEPEKLDKFITEKAGLWFDDGTMFGNEGLGYTRINIACPRGRLEKAMRQLRDAFNKI